MPSNYWIKLYHEILDDPKMGRLPDHLWRRCIELFLIAGDFHKEGHLPELSDMAWRLRSTDEEVTETLNALAAEDIVCQNDTGWIVSHFAARQAAVPGKKRIEQWRDSQRKDTYYGNERATTTQRVSNEVVTNRYADTDTEVDTDPKKRLKTDQGLYVGGAGEEAAATVFKAYQDNLGGLSPMLSEKIGEAIDTYPTSWILEAMGLAVENNVRKWSYAERILTRWQTDGKDNGRGGPKAEKSEIKWIDPTT